MIERTKIRRFGAVLALIAAFLGAIAVFLPWKPWLETRIKASLEAQGFQNVQLTVSSIGPGSVTLKDLSSGGQTPLHLNGITLGFSVPSLLSGRLHEATVTGLALDVRKTGDKWVVTGLQTVGSPTNARTSIPVTGDGLNAIPLDTIRIEDSHLHIGTDQWQMNIPLDLTWQKDPAPKLVYAAKGLGIRAQGINVTTGDAVLNAVLKANDKKWDGQWHINDVKMTGISPDVPVMKGDGTISAGEDEIMIEGQFASADQTYKSNFHVDYFLNEPQKSRLEIIETTLPWNGGTISAQKVSVPLAGKQNLDFSLNVKRVSLGALLQQLTGKQTAATGAISGVLPVTMHADGTFAVQTGKLAAEEPGTIAMPPETIPGDNAQVALARDVLKNFHYSLLSIDVDQDKDNRLSVLMKLEGNNPDVSAGRPVKLNVHLTGDVLNFVQQNLMLLTNPRNLLRQGKDAKP